MTMTPNEVDAKIEASEARTETKFERLLGEMRRERVEMRVWFLITAIFIVVTTVSISDYLEGRRATQFAPAPSPSQIIITVPPDSVVTTPQ